ncbi:hypothetical protein O181_011380 [Austropuccinia psidii MF-1]|uniref:DUF4939 domain-containing protein n=1 Tax=Austropuccinia psidii MF-1 TaxID=1389203 RepID=A0A9Q3BV15_9BASI|nr:hypothetical protein [Austropuccinia psidii MF-1]
MSKTSFKGIGEDGEEEDSDGTKVVPAPSAPSLLVIMKEMAQIMANLQAASSSEVSRPPAFKTQSMRAPDIFAGTQPFKFRSFIQSFQLIFHNLQEDFSYYKKKAIYATSFLIGRAETWIEPYFSHATSKIPSFFCKNWGLFESQLFTLFGETD